MGLWQKGSVWNQIDWRQEYSKIWGFFPGIRQMFKALSINLCNCGCEEESRVVRKTWKTSFCFLEQFFFLVDTYFCKMLIPKKDLPFLPTEA